MTRRDFSSKWIRNKTVRELLGKDDFEAMAFAVDNSADYRERGLLTWWRSLAKRWASYQMGLRVGAAFFFVPPPLIGVLCFKLANQELFFLTNGSQASEMS